MQIDKPNHIDFEMVFFHQIFAIYQREYLVIAVRFITVQIFWAKFKAHWVFNNPII